MKSRWWQLLLLAVSVVAFATTVVIISRGISSRRATRDIRFGLEELDLLIEDGSLREAQAMVPWLAERVQSASGGLQILKRARELALQTGDYSRFAEATELISAEFSGNTVLREVAWYANARNGAYDRAFEHALVLLEQTGNDLYYSWLLLQEPESAGQIGESDTATGDTLVLATLARTSSAEEFQRAWELSGRWEYGHLAALVAMENGDPAFAAAMVDDARLSSRSPLLSYDILMARGEFDSALDVLLGADRIEPETLLRLADHALYTSRKDAARQYYSQVRDHGAALPYQLLINEAWLSTDPDSRSELLQTALEAFPETWPVIEQVVRSVANRDREEALTLLQTHAVSGRESEARLLALQVESAPTRRGYEADVWQLLEQTPSATAWRYAAWYIAAAGTVEDLQAVISRATPEDVSRVLHYRGVVAAREGDWSRAVELFEESFSARATTEAAYNAAIALVRTGYLTDAAARLQDARLLGSGSRRLTVLTLLASSRLEEDPAQALELTRQALEIEPANAEAMLLEQRLRGPRR
jgi:tetratricopeptide (TPR) repeat protein